MAMLFVLIAAAFLDALAAMSFYSKADYTSAIIFGTLTIIFSLLATYRLEKRRVNKTNKIE